MLGVALSGSSMSDPGPRCTLPIQWGLQAKISTVLCAPHLHASLAGCLDDLTLYTLMHFLPYQPLLSFLLLLTSSSTQNQELQSLLWSSYPCLYYGKCSGSYTSLLSYKNCVLVCVSLQLHLTPSYSCPVQPSVTVVLMAHQLKGTQAMNPFSGSLTGPQRARLPGHCTDSNQPVSPHP